MFRRKVRVLWVTEDDRKDNYNLAKVNNSLGNNDLKLNLKRGGNMSIYMYVLRRQEYEQIEKGRNLTKYACIQLLKLVEYLFY